MMPGNVYDKLTFMEKQCARPGWDGYGAEEVSPETIAIAKQFLDALAPRLPTPTVGAEPDGQITFEWSRSPRDVLSVSVGPCNFLHYAALLGAGRRQGTELFCGSVPESIVGLIDQVCS
jgi:hypothetical protein